MFECRIKVQFAKEKLTLLLVTFHVKWLAIYVSISEKCDEQQDLSLAYNQYLSRQPLTEHVI